MIPSLDQANYLRIKGILAAQPCIVKLREGLIWFIWFVLFIWLV